MMKRIDRPTRRGFVASFAAGTVATIAGCSGPGTDTDEDKPDALEEEDVEEEDQPSGGPAFDQANGTDPEGDAQNDSDPGYENEDPDETGGAATDGDEDETSDTNETDGGDSEDNAGESDD